MALLNDISDRLFVKDEKKWIDICRKNYYSDIPLNVKVYKNAVIEPVRYLWNGIGGGVVDLNSKFIAGLTRKIDGNVAEEVKIAYPYDKNKVIYKHETVIFGGMLMAHFGHILVDCLSRLWYHVENLDSNYKIVFVHMWGVKSDWLWDYFDLLSIPRERIVLIDRMDNGGIPICYDEVIVPDQAQASQSYYTDKWLLPINLMAHNALDKINNDKLPEKIYYTRRQLAGTVTTRQVVNEEYAERYYESKGYQVIAPEQYSLVEQIAMIANAKAVACNLGTLSHLVLFCQHPVKLDTWVVDNAVSVIQALINQAKNIDWTVVDCSMNFLPHNHIIGAALFGPTKFWKEYCKKRFGDNQDLCEISDDKIVKYIKLWAEYFRAYPGKYVDGKINDKDIFSIFNDICDVFFDEKPNPSLYKLGESKPQLRKKIELLTADLNNKRPQLAKEEKDVEWLKGVTDKLQTEMLAARETYSKNEEQFKAALKKSEAEVREERRSRIKSESENAKLAAEYNAMRNSLSFKVGRFITFIPRKVRNMFKKEKVKK